jgi:hypothetical protein
MPVQMEMHTTLFWLGNTRCLKKCFTFLIAYINLFRGHVQCFNSHIIAKKKKQSSSSDSFSSLWLPLVAICLSSWAPKLSTSLCKSKRRLEWTLIFYLHCYSERPSTLPFLFRVSTSLPLDITAPGLRDQYKNTSRQNPSWPLHMKSAVCIHCALLYL